MRKGLSLILLIVGLTGCDGAPENRQPPTPRSEAAPSSSQAIDTSAAIAFTSRFYDAYGPRGSESGLAATDSLIREQPDLFTPELLGALRRDAQARAAAVGEIDGLDFEPFLNSQDPCPRYYAGPPATGAGPPKGALRVWVRATCDRARGAEPTFAIDVVPYRDSWRIANVIYGPPAGDLLSLLRRLHPPAT